MTLRLPRPYGYPMGATSFSVKLSALKRRRRLLTEDEAETLQTGIEGVIHDFLEARLTRAADLSMLEDIEACAAELVELDCDELRRGKLTFHIHAHWRSGAEAAEHWHRLAIAATAGALDEVVQRVGYRLATEQARQLVAQGTSRPLALIDERLFALDEEGAPLTAEGEMLKLSCEERERLQELARARRCECQLCQPS